MTLQDLPITELFPTLRQQLKSHAQILIQSPTGSGKSTALPAEMLNWPEINGKILMLEPRRVATRSIAQFIAKNRGGECGEEVGFRVRGETKVNSQTRLEVVTEGVLTRMIQTDPELTGIDVIIFDEVHERHLTTDLGLALAIEIQQGFRDDLKIILMSATLDKDSVAHILPDAISLQSEGRMFPVSIEYCAPSDSRNYLNTIKFCLSNLINNDEYHGDILIFLPGKAEILRLQRELDNFIPSNCLCTPLFGELSNSEQDLALKPMSNKRKVILATNIAESSLTIDGVRLVIDSGLKKHASYNPKTGITRLNTKPISQASATQRAGRAGRQTDGHCIRIWRKEDHERREKFDAPEITQANLVDLAFNSAIWGAKSINALPLITSAPKPNEQTAWQLLQQLEYVDNSHKLTKLGQHAYPLGTTPRLSHMLLKAQQQSSPELLALACCLAAIVEAHHLPRKGCDIQNYLHLSLSGQCNHQTLRFLKLCKCNFDIRQAVKHAHWKDIGFLLAQAFPDRIAQKRSSGKYLLANGSGVELPLEDSLNSAEYLVIADLQEVQSQKSTRAYLASELDSSLFLDQLKYLTSENSVANWDDKTAKFKAEQQQRVGAIILKKIKLTQLNETLVINAILDQITKQGLSLLRWDETVEQLQLKVALAKQHETTLKWPDFSDSCLLESMDNWLKPYLIGINSLKQLQKMNMANILKNTLTWEQQQWLDSELPDKWSLSTGTKAPIRYTEDGRALMSVRLQEILGMPQSPSLAHNRIVVTMELLSPARRPIAVTADLSSFWDGPYHELKKEMRGQYPKHLWPDNPQDTVATKFTKKKAGL